MQSSCKCWPTEDAIIIKVLMAKRQSSSKCRPTEDASIIKVLTTEDANTINVLQSSSKCWPPSWTHGDRRAEYKQSVTMYRVVPSSTFATITSAVKAQSTWPWHRHMWRGSYHSRLDFSKASSASTHAHKSAEPRCYLPTTHTRANKVSHPRPNQNSNFFSRALAEDALIIKVLTGRRCNYHQSFDHRRCNHHLSVAIIIKVLTAILKNWNSKGRVQTKYSDV